MHSDFTPVNDSKLEDKNRRTSVCTEAMTDSRASRLAVSSLTKLELRGNNEHVSCYKTQRLVGTAVPPEANLHDQQTGSEGCLSALFHHEGSGRTGSITGVQSERRTRLCARPRIRTAGVWVNRLRGTCSPAHLSMSSSWRGGGGTCRMSATQAFYEAWRTETDCRT